ncbi:hypothetical protein BDW66DRAFT_124510 [Aspergillus desertorum]
MSCLVLALVFLPLFYTPVGRPSYSRLDQIQSKDPRVPSFHWVSQNLPFGFRLLSSARVMIALLTWSALRYR